MQDMHAEHHHYMFRENLSHPLDPRPYFFTLVKQQAFFKCALTSGAGATKPEADFAKVWQLACFPPK